ncbi:MAG: cytochrome c [Salinarimonas sp.]|nr:cytochrome c [Salinarimonas sp.]
MTARSPIRWLTGAAALLVFAVGSPDAARAEAEDGRIIAERWCASCHLVGPGQDVASDQVPTFMQIAGDYDLDADELRRFLQMPHPPMPDMQLTHREIRSLIAYIDSLAP